MYSFEDLQKLSDLIDLYKNEKKRPADSSHFDLREDIEWGASYFYANILLESYYKEDTLITESRFEELAKEHESKIGVSLSLKTCFEKGWLRLVFGYVTFPDVVDGAISKYQQIQQLKAQFDFFESLTKEEVKAITNEEQLNARVKQYDQDLSVDDSKNEYWHLKEDKIEFLRLDFSRFLFAYSDLFDFFITIRNKQEDNSLRIGSEALQRIHAAHQSYFERTPPIDDLITSGVFEQVADANDIKIHLRPSGGWAKDLIRDRAGAILWEKLTDRADFADDTERIRFWYYRVIYHQGYVVIKNFFSQQMKERFLPAALDLVVNDADLGTGNLEYLKLRTDTRFSRDQSLLYSPELPAELIPISDSEDLFELHANLGHILRGHSDNLMYAQRSRHAITYLITQLVDNDYDRAHNFINGLFEKANKQPFVFWYTCMTIVRSHPEILPYLALGEKTAALAFALFLKSEVTSYTGTAQKKIKIDLAKKLFEVIAGNLAQSSSVSGERRSKIIFQYFLRASGKKFRLEPEKQVSIEIFQEINSVLTHTELPGTHYDGALRIRPLFFPELLDGLFSEIAAHRPVDVYQNGLTTLPFVQLDLAIMLITLARQKDSKGETIGTVKQLQDFAKYFKDCYLEIINIDKIQKIDFFGDGQLKPTIPSWHDQRANDVLIRWDIACLQMEMSFEFDQFLTPASLVFNTSIEKYDEENRFIAQKLRTHLFVLIEAFNSIYNNRQQFDRSGFPVKNVLDKLELRITSYTVQFSVFEPVNRRYDIFDESFERWFGRVENGELLPLIGAIINRFAKQNREAVIIELTRSEQILRSLKLLEHIVSEKEKRRLLKILTDREDFIPIMDKLSFQDMQFVVLTLSQNEDFITIAEDALAYTELVAERDNYTYTRNDNQAFIFRMKLMQAFQKRDIDAIDQVPNLESNHYHGQRFISDDEKDFYKALVYLRTGSGKTAYELFHKLASNAKEDRPILALNRFAAKLQWADETADISEKRALAYEALNQWEQFKSSYPDQKAWPAIRENVWYNQLHTYETLEDFENFEISYSEIDPVTRMRSDFLSIRLEMLLKRRMQHQAEELLLEAKTFHQLADGSYPDFIEGLEKLSNTPEALSQLTAQYDRIFRLPPDELIQVIPASANGGKDLPGFILNEILNAAKDMLDLVNVLPNIDYEDKYTDLILLSLNGRLVNYKWHAANLRAGFSDKDDPIKQHNPGEIDLGIFTSSNSRLAICEAMILEGKNTIETQKHNLKIFNYDPVRKLYYLLVYYKGSAETFGGSWDSYVDVVESFIEFPQEYKIIGKVDTLTLPNPSDTIRLGKSIHGVDTALYHLFINVNYRLDLNKKKVGIN